MRTLKFTDLLMQPVIVLGFGLYFLLRQHHSDDVGFILIYFILGGWQLLSFFIHLFCSFSWIGRRDRKRYGLTVLFTILSGCFAWLGGYDVVILYLFFVLVFTPILAIWYYIIGISEWGRIKQKALAHMK